MIRREPTYLSTDVWRCLWLLAKTRSPAEGQVATADEVADQILRETITERYPQLFEHQKQVAKMEKDLIKTLT
jgi:hypothetical protein